MAVSPAKSDAHYNVWAIQDYRTGLLGNVVIYDVNNKWLYEYISSQDETAGAEHWSTYKEKASEPSEETGFYLVGTGYESLDKARYVALQAQVGDLFKARIQDSMPLAWISFTQLFYVLVLFSPGVVFVGSMYAAVAQVAVVISASMSNAPYLMTATRVSTAVAMGNVLLSLLVWQSAYSTVDKIGAAYRAALVTVIGFAMVCTNEYLSRVADSHRNKRSAFTAQ